jgi:hypothetical protein
MQVSRPGGWVGGYLKRDASGRHACSSRKGQQGPTCTGIYKPKVRPPAILP